MTADLLYMHSRVLRAISYRNF